MPNLLALFGCAHSRYTFPQTPVYPDGHRGETTVQCLDCCQRVPYDWREMRVRTELRVERRAVETVGVEA